jgi:diguanylate cyclase (GGDEF)-like protein
VISAAIQNMDGGREVYDGFYRAYAAEIRKLALLDQLTGVLNRRGFEERAGAEISRARRHEESLAVVYLDLDGFKRVNDNLSHAAGDRVLRRAAPAMAGVLRGEDVLARMGGDEFVVLLHDACDAEADAVAARLVSAVEEVAAVEPGAEHVSATTAWSAFPADGETLDALLNAADARMLERARPVSR